jgi:hypothetical protein
MSKAFQFQNEMNNRMQFGQDFGCCSRCFASANSANCSRSAGCAVYPAVAGLQFLPPLPAGDFRFAPWRRAVKKLEGKWKIPQNSHQPSLKMAFHILCLMPYSEIKRDRICT